MSRVEIKQTIQIYEVEGKEIKGLDYPTLGIESHWNDNERVILVLPSGKRITVVGADLQTAINNAMNSGRI